jgi:Recombinase
MVRRTAPRRASPDEESSDGRSLTVTTAVVVKGDEVEGVAANRVWNPMSIRAMLSRDIYRGEIVWGRMEREDRNGRAGLCSKQEAKEWLRVSVPELRIVEKGLWDTVQKRLALMNEDYLRDSRGKPDLRREGR